jgi:uncharacterized protein
MQSKSIGSPELKRITPKIVEILKRHNVKRAGVFGSYARGEQKKSSDIDILIEAADKKFSLLDQAGLEIELEKKLRKKVELITYNGINPLLKDRILKEELRII